MAWSILRPPGHNLGPCLDEACGHSDCADTRRLAEQTCTICGSPLGYDRQIAGNYAVTLKDEGRIVHWSCLTRQLGEIENKSKARHAPGQPKLDLGE